MWNGGMKEVAKLDYFLYTLDTRQLIRKDAKNCTKWIDRNGICVAMMEKRKGCNKFLIKDEVINSVMDWEM